MWLNYNTFKQIYEDKKDYKQEIPEGYVSSLGYLYTLKQEMIENKERIQRFKGRIGELSKEIDECTKIIKKSNSERNKHTEEKDDIFNNVLKNNELIDIGINEINEKIQPLDAVIAENEGLVVKYKDEIVKARENLMQNVQEATTLKSQYIEAVSRMETDCIGIENEELTDFEKADIDTADKMMKELLIASKNENQKGKDIPNEAIEELSSTKILAKCYQEEAKIEREAHKYIKKVLDKIDDKSFSMDKFEDKTKKIEEAYNYIHTVGHETLNLIINNGIIAYNTKEHKKIENATANSLYESVDKSLSAVHDRLYENITRDQYAKVYDEDLNCREGLINKYKKINIFQSFLHPDRGELLKTRIKYLDIVAGWMPFDNLPAETENSKEDKHDKKKDMFRESLKVIEAKKLKASQQQPTKTVIQREER